MKICIKYDLSIRFFKFADVKYHAGTRNVFKKNEKIKMRVVLVD